MCWGYHRIITRILTPASPLSPFPAARPLPPQAPVTTHKLYNDVKNYKDIDHFETPYVVKFHRQARGEGGHGRRVVAMRRGDTVSGGGAGRLPIREGGGTRPGGGGAEGGIRSAGHDKLSPLMPPTHSLVHSLLTFFTSLPPPYTPPPPIRGTTCLPHLSSFPPLPSPPPSGTIFWPRRSLSSRLSTPTGRTPLTTRGTPACCTSGTLRPGQQLCTGEGGGGTPACCTSGTLRPGRQLCTGDVCVGGGGTPA